jgi:hypothetical protein
VPARIELARRDHRVVDPGGGERLVDDLDDPLLGQVSLVARPDVTVKTAAGAAVYGFAGSERA